MPDTVAKRFIALAISFLGTAIPSARATVIGGDGVLDQAHVVDFSAPLGMAWGLESPYEDAQTFTVGRSGLLSRLELQVWGANTTKTPTDPLVATFRRTLGDGSPDLSPGSVLATVTFQPAELTNGWFTAAFAGKDLGDQAFPVEAGGRVALVVTTADPRDALRGPWYAWGKSVWRRRAVDVDYAGGMVWAQDFPQGPLVAYPNEDAGFRTFVVTVPEPTTLLPLVAAASFLFLPPRLRNAGNWGAGWSAPRTAPALFPGHFSPSLRPLPK
jgi:hypothetical protein